MLLFIVNQKVLKKIQHHSAILCSLVSFNSAKTSSFSSMKVNKNFLKRSVCILLFAKVNRKMSMLSQISRIFSVLSIRSNPILCTANLMHLTLPNLGNSKILNSYFFKYKMTNFSMDSEASIQRFERKINKSMVRTIP